MKRMTMKFMALTLMMVASTAALYAQGVAFTSTSLPRQMRQEGLTETAGEVVLTALNAGIIPAVADAGSTIDLVFSVAITNDDATAPAEISLANNVTCAGPGFAGVCPAGLVSASLIGASTVRLRFLTVATAFVVSDQINISRIRVNANAALGVGSVSVTMSGISQNPSARPITFTDPQRQVGVLNASLTVSFNHSTATLTPVTQLRSCAFPNDAIAAPGALPGAPTVAAFHVPNAFSLRITEVFPGALTTLATETLFSPVMAPVNGSQISITLSNVPVGLTAAFSGTTGLTAGFSVTLATPATVDQTAAGTPIVFVFNITTADASLVERGTFVFQTKPITTSTANPLAIASIGAPVNIQAAVSLGPVSTVATTIVRFAANQIGPTTVATVSDCTTRLLLTWVATVADVETGVAIANTSNDDAAFGAGTALGASSQNGTCTLTGYPSAGGTPVSFTTSTINAGSTLAFLMSATTGFTNFTGYVLTVCNFEAAHAFAFISDGRGVVTGPKLAQGYLANVIQPGSRPPAAGTSESLGN